MLTQFKFDFLIMKLRDFLFTFFIFLISSAVHAQYTNFKFENFDTLEGISSSTCLEIFQDSDGYLWFGTIDGLNKYNGYSFEVFRPELNNPHSLSNNRINAIVEDGNGLLWIGTSNGLNVYNKHTEKFHLVQITLNEHSKINPAEVINDLLYNKNTNSIWVGTKNGALYQNDLIFSPIFGKNIRMPTN